MEFDMKDAEDEAFDELAKRQGMWGGGFQAKRAMAADKLQEPPSEWAGIKAILDEYGLQAIDFVADFKAALAGRDGKCKLCVDGCAACDARAQPAQEPVALADLVKEAQQIVKSKFLWKKFIDGTPLANDIAFWMADFAQQYTAPPQRPWVGLTDEETQAYWDWEDWQTGAGRSTIFEMVKDIEAKLKEKNG